ncbi:MAG TPA: hypothetical protein VMZ91_11760 [Candidatus Paceibacterota bacterium]|nr:hypothetical protein [Candidatus Paceibacterota bacterium]
MKLYHCENNLSYNNDYMHPGIEEEDLDIDVKNGVKIFSLGSFQNHTSIIDIAFFLTEEEEEEEEEEKYHRVISLQKYYSKKETYFKKQEKKQREKDKREQRKEINREKEIVKINKQRKKRIAERIKQREKRERIKQIAIEKKQQLAIKKEQQQTIKEQQRIFKEIQRSTKKIQRSAKKTDQQRAIKYENLLIKIKKEEEKEKEWLKIAEKIVKENKNGTLYTHKKMKEIGHHGLFLYMEKHPKTFAHIKKNKTFDCSKSVLRGKIKHEIALKKYRKKIEKIINENNGELPSLQSLKSNDYQLYVFVKKYPEETLKINKTEVKIYFKEEIK